MSSTNAKNRLKELLESLGWSLEGQARFHIAPGRAAMWHCEVEVEVPSLPPAQGAGDGLRSSQAEVAACADVLTKLSGLASDLDELMLEAQAGDALIKLAAYRASEHRSAAHASLWLQRFESDARLARLYDAWRDAGREDLLHFGPRLGVKMKASCVEAAIWRDYQRRTLGTGAMEALRELRRALEAEEAPLHEYAD